MKALNACSGGGMNHWKTLLRRTTSEPLSRSPHSRMFLFTTSTLFSKGNDWNHINNINTGLVVTRTLLCRKPSSWAAEYCGKRLGRSSWIWFLPFCVINAAVTRMMTRVPSSCDFNSPFLGHLCESAGCFHSHCTGIPSNEMWQK